MKKSIFYLYAFILIFSFVFYCSKDKVTEPEIQELTEEEQEIIEQTHSNVTVTADSVLITENPMQGFEQMLSTYQNDPNIENAWLTDNALFVKYKKGGIVSWSTTESDVKPPYLPKSSVSTLPYKKSSSSDLVGNNKVCLMNQQYNDESRPYCREIINRLSNNFSDNEFDVTSINGSDLDLIFFDSDLKDYGTIFYITHGHYDGTNTWICTGQEGEISFLTRLWYWDWYNNQISIGTVKEERDGEEVPIQYVTISNLFIEDEYNSDDFPNSLIYMSACQFFKSQNFGIALNNCGAGVVVGWDETNCKGKFIGEDLLNSMLGGVSLSEAFDILPSESIIDFCDTTLTEGANLTYYPNSGGSIRLVEAVTNPPDIQINSPVDGNTYYTRLLTFSGEVINAESIDYGTLELNNITTTLEISGLDFSQPIVINSGSNTIKVTCLTKLFDESSATVSKSITINGDFPVLDLFTELRWNTNYSDVDLHLLPPNSDLDDLFTNNDCYFNNMSTYWGAELDVDDVEGYGPEHIEMQNYQISGEYRLFVHYYDDDGAGTTQAFVDISSKGGDLINFGPYQLINSNKGYNSNNSIGDVYEVCKIEYPSGNVTPVNQYHYISGSLAKSISIKSTSR